MAIHVEMSTLHATAFGYVRIPSSRVIFCSLSVAAFAPWTILLADDVELDRSGVGDGVGSSTAADAIASCALGSAMLGGKTSSRANSRHKAGSIEMIEVETMG